MEGQTLFHRTLLNEAGDPIKIPEHTRYQIFLQIIHEDKKSATSVNRKPTLNEVYTHFESFLSLAVSLILCTDLLIKLPDMLH